MLIFDQLKKNDPHLRWLALGVLSGLAILAAGLWWVQIVSARDYQANLETQSSRTVRIPAQRGKILDRNGITLAENRPTYNISLYLEELQTEFEKEFKASRPRKTTTNSPPFWKFWSRSAVVSTNYPRMSKKQLDLFNWECRIRVTSNIVRQISAQLKRPLPFDSAQFRKHYLERLAMPFPVASNLSPSDIARFEEQSANIPGTDLEIQSTRSYPNETLAAHLLGHLQRINYSLSNELAVFDFRLPDFRGVIGMERAYDSELRGTAGSKLVVVNNLGYRQTETLLPPAVPGNDVVLTIDAHIQQAAEHALQRGPLGVQTRGAAVVMDVRNGDVLALASNPTFNPKYWVEGFPPGEYDRISSSGAEGNRATQQNYRPGSIFKPVVALACLESGLDVNAIYNVQPNPKRPTRGIIYVGARGIGDTAPPGPYNFKKALIHSSNCYFIANGLPAIDRIIEFGNLLHLGRAFGLGTAQETSGLFPKSSKTPGLSKADLCFGQGYIDVTPLQMTVIACTLANGGKVLPPRLVDRIIPQDSIEPKPPKVFPPSEPTATLNLSAHTQRVLRDAMLADVEEAEGTGTRARVEGLKICAKTGTAQNARNGTIDQTTWFLSYAPYESPKYAVVVMVEMGSDGSGGSTCAPIAREIYLAIQHREQTEPNPNNLARSR